MRRLGIVVILTVLAVLGLFASPAFAQEAEIDISADDCTVVARFTGAEPGSTAGVIVGGIPPTADAGTVAEETVTVGASGEATIVIPLQFTTPPAQNDQWHVHIAAGVVDPGPGVLDERNVFVSDCPDPVAPTTPVITTTVPVPVGGVDTGSGTGPGAGVLIPLAGLGLLAASTYWMRRRATHTG
jgi:hypothetical protein